MIIRCDELQKICSKILIAVDNNPMSNITETLAIYTQDNFLYMAVTNREYFVKIKLDLQDTNTNFNATVSAELFLKLISKMTTETIELSIEDNSLIIKGNGLYKLPMIYDGDELLKLPEIGMVNITSEFDIDTTILHSIYNYNSKEFAKKQVVANPVQTMYYLDDKGCITFTSGACVNKFNISTPIKVLLTDKIVKLFKLFSGEKVHICLAQDDNNASILTKMRFTSNSVELTAIINSDDAMINSVPESVIRNMAFDTYTNAIVINKNSMLNAIERIMLFVDNTLNAYGNFDFKKDKIIIHSINDSTEETIYYENALENELKYSAMFDLNDVKASLSGMKTSHVTMNFGNGKSAVLIENNVYNIIPECVV